MNIFKLNHEEQRVIEKALSYLSSNLDDAEESFDHGFDEHQLDKLRQKIESPPVFDGNLIDERGEFYIKWTIDDVIHSLKDPDSMTKTQAKDILTDVWQSYNPNSGISRETITDAIPFRFLD